MTKGSEIRGHRYVESRSQNQYHIVDNDKGNAYLCNCIRPLILGEKLHLCGGKRMPPGKYRRFPTYSRRSKNWRYN